MKQIDRLFDRVAETTKKDRLAVAIVHYDENRGMWELSYSLSGTKWKRAVSYHTTEDEVNAELDRLKTEYYNEMGSTIIHDDIVRIDIRPAQRRQGEYYAGT